MSSPVRIVFLGGLGEIGRNCFCLEVDGPHPRRRLRDHVPRRRHARRRPGAPRLHVPAGERRPGRGRAPHPRARGPRRRARVPAPRRRGADLRLAALARAGPQPHRGSGDARPHRADPGRTTANAGTSARSTASSSRSRTRCRTASRPRSSRPRARSSTPATSSSTSRRSTAAAPTSRCSARSPAATAACGCCCPTRRTRSGPGSRRRSRRSGSTMRTLFREHPTSGSSSRASRRTCTACSRSRRPRSRTVASIAFVGRSMEHNVSMSRELGFLDIPAHAIIDIEETARYAPGEVCIICTGSQGEPMSALSLMAAHEHKHVKISDDDVVVICAHAIPGNESNVSRVIDALHRAGAEVVHDRNSAGARLGPRVAGRAEVHAEPGAARVVRARTRRVPPPRPPRAARARRRASNPSTCSCARTATSSRSPTKVPELDHRAVPSGYMYVDGIVGDIGHGVLRDRRVARRRRRRRRHRHGRLAHRRDRDRARDRDPRLGVRARGRRPARGGQADGARPRSRRPPTKAPPTSRRSAATPRRSLGRFIDERTRRRPIVIPVVMEV